MSVFASDVAGGARLGAAMSIDDCSTWPELLQRVAEVAGKIAALDLAQAYGGTEVYVPLPEKIGETHPLAIAMGLGAARATARELGGFGAVLSIPMGPRAPLIARRAEVARLTGAGDDQSSIARRLNVSVRTVRRDQRRLRLQARC